MKSILKKFAAEESGAAMVEYSILIGIITAAAIATIIAVGGYVGTAWTTLCTALGTTCAAPTAG